MPDIRSWQDYPEFLERVEEEIGATREELSELSDEELASALYDFNPKVATLRAGQAIRETAISMLPSGLEGARIEWSDYHERYFWRNVQTGQFARAPSS